MRSIDNDADALRKNDQISARTTAPPRENGRGVVALVVGAPTALLIPMALSLSKKKKRLIEGLVVPAKSSTQHTRISSTYLGIKGKTTPSM
jgi:hypothetical protein